ncbi:sulfatase [Elizabethkingia anophelis]|uniref:sulfatase n=1 Tax=Elizabethkingia anophelis TaxID=1117645 RepID=UPI0021A9613A
MKKTNYVMIFLCICISFSTIAQNKKINVLFIASDDLNVDEEVFDNPQVKTPNLKRLFSMGVKFDRAYSQFPLCGPSRASLMTGLRPDQTGVKDLSTFFRDNIPNVETLPQMFMKNGYFSARVGKIYHYGVPSQIGTNGQDDALSWNVRINPIGIDKQQEDKITNYMPGVPLGGALSFWAAPGTDDDQTDGKVANEAVKLMEEHKDKPFFLAVGFFRPHTPYVAPKKYFDMYPLEKITLAKQSDTDWDNKPAIAKYTLKDNYGLTEQQQKEVKRAYYASISFMDAQVGKLLDKLDQLGLADNTIIVFWSDHGYALGQHKQWHKQQLFEHVARVPLLIAAPGFAKKKGTKSTAELIDLYPTLANLAGIKAPAEIQGKSLVPVLKEPSKTIDTPAFTQLDKTLKQKLWYPNIDKDYTGRSVRYKEWRYTEWNEGKDGSELYNYEKDPDEFNNLANNPKYSKVVARMKEMLKKQ